MVGLLVVAVLVLGLGAGIRAPSNEAPSYSASELAQLDAENRYRSLARAARAAAPTEPAFTELLTATAEDLDVQAAAVALPRPGQSDPRTNTNSASASAPESESASASPSASASLPDGTELIAALRVSALTSLGEAMDAEPGPARVLASAGARQWERAHELGAALDVDPGLPVPDAGTAAHLATGTGPFAGLVRSPAPADATPSPDTPERLTGSTNAVPDAIDGAGIVPLGPGCAGTPAGPETDRQALELALTAEHRARYGYQVAAALLPDRDVFLHRAAEHGAAAGTATDQLERRCIEPRPAPAGFALPIAFREDPAGELRRLEEQHVDMYASHVASVSPQTRAWAVVELVASVVRNTDSGAAPQPLPGIDDAGPKTRPGSTTGTSAPPEEPADD